MKKILAIFLVATMLFSVACNSASETNVSVSQEVISENNVQYPLNLVDQVGREVTIESEPQRIVSGYYISTSLLIALGLQDKVVGVESNPEKRPVYSYSAPELLSLQTVGSIKEFDLEACAALNPDLVILPFKLKSVADTLTELGINVIVVMPESEELLIETIQLVAKATNRVDRGNELTQYIGDVKDFIIDSLGSTDKVSVYLSGNSDFLSTAPKSMYQSYMIDLAGAINAGDEIEDDYWVEVSYEQVLTWNPKYIIIAAAADYGVEDVLNNENLKTLDAVANGNVYKLPSDAEAWDSPVPSSVLGSLWLSSTLHPDKISKEQCNEIIEKYYKTFYGFSYNSIATEKAA